MMYAALKHMAGLPMHVSHVLRLCLSYDKYFDVHESNAFSSLAASERA